MLRPFPLRVLVLVIVFALVAAGCGDGGADTSTTVVAGSGTVDSGDDLVPLPSGLVIDEDPDSPVAATLTFDSGVHPIDHIDYLGPKTSTNLPPTAALIYLVGFEEALLFDFDASGSPSVMHLGDVGELRIEAGASELTFSYVAPDGSVSVETVPLAAGGDTPEAMLDSGKAATAQRVRHFDASVDVNRAVFTHVSVSSSDAPLPPDLPAPYLRIAGCHTTRSNVTFACSRVPGQVIESHNFVRTHRLTMTHSASAVVPGVDPSIWPSAQACQAALGNDWWVNEGVGVSLGTTANTLGTGLLAWLAANPQAAAAGVAAGQGFIPAIAISAAAVVGFHYGKRAAEEHLMGSETDCENIERRVNALDVLGMTIEDVAFTIEVCLPPVEGWTFDHGCQDIGPYRPFSSALATVTGDDASLDRNRLAPVEFIATPEPGAVAGIITDAETGEPIPGVAISLSEPGFETTTDPAGSFTIDAVPAGPHGLFASADGYAEASQPVQVTTGEDTQVAITLDRTVEALAFPRTYAGTGDLTFTSDFTTGACIVDAELTVTLLPDGLVEGTLEAATFRFSFETSDGATALVCIDGDPYVTGLVGTHGAGELRLSVASSPDEVWLPGGYQLDLLTIDHQIQSEVSQDVTITYFSDWVFILPHQNG